FDPWLASAIFGSDNFNHRIHKPANPQRHHTQGWDVVSRTAALPSDPEDEQCEPQHESAQLRIQKSKSPRTADHGSFYPLANMPCTIVSCRLASSMLCLKLAKTDVLCWFPYARILTRTTALCSDSGVGPPRPCSAPQEESSFMLCRFLSLEV